jgi:hypothetical protein
MKTTLYATIAAVVLVAGPGSVSAAGGQAVRYTGHFVGIPEARIKLVVADSRAAFTFKNVPITCDDGTARTMDLDGGPVAKVRADGHFSVKGRSAINDPHNQEQTFYLIDGKVLSQERIRGSFFFYNAPSSGPVCVTGVALKWEAEAR